MDNELSSAPLTDQAEAKENGACPRCRGPLAQFPGDLGAGSRASLGREWRICGPCGLDEAVRDSRGLPPTPPGEWPVSGPLLTWTSPA